MYVKTLKDGYNLMASSPIGYAYFHNIIIIINICHSFSFAHVLHAISGNTSRSFKSFIKQNQSDSYMGNKDIKYS